MGQPVWITEPGSLGVIPENIFYQIPLKAYDPDDPDNPNAVYYVMLAGSLPAGIQCQKTGLIEGTPKAISSLQGVPAEVARDVTSVFAVRAYTERIVDGVEVIDRVADRTFSITVGGQDEPEFLTPAGLLGTFYDGTEISLQLLYREPDPGDTATIRLISGRLPPGVAVSSTGLIAGAIQPLVGPPGTARAGFDLTPKDEYPQDFTTRSTSQNFQFTLEITDGKSSNIRTYEIFVYSKDSMTADTTDFTADNAFITADIVPGRTPVLLTRSLDFGRVRADNYFTYKFDAVDFDGDAVTYEILVGPGVGFDVGLFDETDVPFDRSGLSLPPGLTINPNTGWFYGYIPDQGATEFTYQFGVRVYKTQFPTFISPITYFTMTIVGDIDTEVQWITGPDLGSIDNGAISVFSVAAENVGGRSLQYRLVQGSDSQLPQGLTLLPSGNIVGRVSFNTFALDGGTTTFDVNRDTRLGSDPTTFDLQFEFDVNAYAPSAEQLGYQVSSIKVTNGGSGYVSQPIITIQPPPNTINAIAATAGVAIIEGGVITAIEIGNAGQGYVSPPLITIVGGGGSGATALTTVSEFDVVNTVSVVRRFTITVNRVYNEPYESLYVKCMPPLRDRELISDLLQNQNLFPINALYRPDDPNFGVSSGVEYVHAYGLASSALEDYVAAMNINHYWKNVVLGSIKTARALAPNGEVLYEVVFSEIIDDLVNQQGQSVGKQVQTAFPVQTDQGLINIVYPNSLIDMRDQMFESIGRLAPGLPLWMTSKQENGNVLGYVPCWVLCYTRPGESGRILYNLQQQFGTQLNLIDFKIDRYELDRSQTHLWDPVTDKWIPYPPESTYFDGGTTIFDGGSTMFNSPADRWTDTDAFDKYLLFPKTNILG